MTGNIPKFALLVLLVLFAGCGRDTAPEPAVSDSQASRNAEANTSDSAAPAKAQTPLGDVIIRADGQPKYDLKEFTVAAGTEVTLTLRHTGTMPKETMGHNVVILTMATDPEAFVEAAREHVSNDYIPPEMEDSIIARTDMLGGGQSDTISFTAPRMPGDRTFLCSFPGHYKLGMKGIIHVK